MVKLCKKKSIRDSNIIINTLHDVEKPETRVREGKTLNRFNPQKNSFKTSNDLEMELNDAITRPTFQEEHFKNV